MGQKIYWAVLGNTMHNGRLVDLEIVRVVEEEGKEFDVEKTFYTTYKNFENKIIAEDVEGLISQLDEMRRDILLHGIKFIRPGEGHAKNLEILKANQEQMDA